MYKVYLCFDNKILPWSLHRSCNEEIATAAFADLVNCKDLDVADFVAVLKDGRKILAMHRFSEVAGSPNFWRGRLHAIPWNGAHSAPLAKAY